MDKDLARSAIKIVSAAPCCIELPAGCGKTQLLAATVAVSTRAGERSLVLTHTNAGVDAIRKRLQLFGVSPSSYHLTTIVGWAFSLVRSYSTIAGLSVPEYPDWGNSIQYVDGAIRVAKSKSMANTHAQSFKILLVDEYQDCSIAQHHLIDAIRGAIPRTVVFGDPLQAIFGFGDPLVNWARGVLQGFPRLNLQLQPYRWLEHNPALGEWLLSARENLVEGSTFDISEPAISGLAWVPSTSQQELSRIAHNLVRSNETVVLLDKWPDTVARHAALLNGKYLIIEDLQGKFMQSQLRRLPNPLDYRAAEWLCSFAKKCFTGLSKLDQPITKSLSNNLSISHYSRKEIQSVVDALEDLRVNPCHEGLYIAARTIQGNSTLHLYRQEAWNDTLKAIRLSISNEALPVDNLTSVRERIRKIGRPHSARVASRTLLVKGLEYDHAIIANLASFKDPRHLYVALTRARRTITILGQSPQITLKHD